MLAAAARRTGHYSLAQQLYGDSVALSGEVGRLGMIPTEHHNLGYVALHEGDINGAELLFRRALTEARQYKATFIFPYLILDFGVLALARGDLLKAATLVVAADARFEALGIALDPDDAAECEAVGETTGRRARRPAEVRGTAKRPRCAWPCESTHWWPPKVPALDRLT